MKTDLEYIRQALENWCKAHRWEKDLPPTPSWYLSLLNDATTLREKDKKAAEGTGA